MSELNRTGKDHSVATGTGAVGGGAAGAAIGTAAGGPAGAVVGAAVGAVSGAFLGHEVGEAADPEDIYWRDNYASRDYVTNGEAYSLYRPAYAYGWTARRKAGKGSWDEFEAELKRGWDSFGDKVKLKWDRARNAVRDGWHHVERSMPGDFDGDGR